MSELWYQNPKILLTNLDQFFPNTILSRSDKINATARFAIYYTILIIIFKQDAKWMSISVILLLLSFFLGTTEEFKSKNDDVYHAPTKENPFMNFTLGDLFDHPERNPGYGFYDIKDEVRKEYRSHLYSDPMDVWGKYITDRNYYTMPNTSIVNDQTGFAMACFGNSGVCKTDGKDCLKYRDPTYNRGRYTVTGIDEP
jgi:hypothetical protein